MTAEEIPADKNAPDGDAPAGASPDSAASAAGPAAAAPPASDPEHDDFLDSVLIGGREHRAIVVVDYDEAWPERYEALAATIRGAVGAGVRSLDHIGSTSVPGLAAKPIIDILLMVDDVGDEASFVSPLERAGFVLRVREPGHRMLRTPELDVHLHVYAAGSGERERYLDLRDWLRHDRADRDLYAATKRELAKRDWSDMNYYADAKDDVVAVILGHAVAWRASTTP
jgi:GrpB-like predicted nucleotidyltransferase (UPF0157 family)